MKNRRRLIGAAAMLGFFILILDSRTAFQGASEGLWFCLQTVIPSLFPFFVLSGLITGSFCGGLPLLHPLGSVFRIPSGGESILLCAFLGGYPVGGHAVVQSYRSGQLSRSQAEKLLPYCNQAGPSFLFGMVSCLFEDRKTVWLLWGILILSALMTAKLYAPEYTQAGISPSMVKNHTPVIETAGKAILCVCGWITVFRVALTFLDRWFLWMLPDAASVFFTGLLELANGCCEISKVTSQELRFLISGCILASGGVCVTMQTATVAPELSMKHYCIGKLAQTMFTFVLCMGILLKLWVIPAAALVFAFFPIKTKKTSSIPRKAIV